MQTKPRDLKNYFAASRALEALNRSGSALVVRQTAIGNLKVDFQSVKNGGSARFNDFPNSPRPSDVHSTLTELAATLPKSNGATFSQKIPLTVGIITDLYMFNFYKDVFEKIVYLTPSNYGAAFAENIFDVILYVSCWSGIKDDEWRGIKFRERPAQAFAQILNAAKKQRAVTIFQSIEDPSNFENFVPLAKQFDVIFTSDAESINRYKSECGHDAVFYGEYGVNPLLHNPIGCRTHVFNSALFAGSWAGRYPERCEDMRAIFSSIRDCGASLTIVDRNFGTTAEEFQYPEEYRDGVLPSVDHELLQSLHKLFRYNVNLNSIKGSSTMCAMRIYELQAMGVGILSNYARSVFNKFPDIRLLPFYSDLSFDFAPEETFEEYQRNMRRLRGVMTSKTAFDVTARMLENAGVNFPAESQPRVAVFCDTSNPSVMKLVDDQSYEYCQAVSEGEAESDERWSRMQSEGFSFFTWFDPDCAYGPDYIQDMVNACKYTKSAFVTKHAWFSPDGYVGGPQHEFTKIVAGRARTVFSSQSFQPSRFVKKPYHEATKCEEIGYAIDPFELSGSKQAPKKKFKAKRPYRLSVIVPVYNNGRFLLSKCIESLKRNEIWNDMEVLLVDDGSTDGVTVEIVEKLAVDNPNVKTRFFNDGGSGSASRARNAGIKMATAPLIAFLDPDNEISSGGYDKLVSLYREASSDETIDFVAGFHVKSEVKSSVIGKHSAQPILKVGDLKKRFLESGKFPVIPTQPAVIRRDVLMSNPLIFIEGAAGQDTLFGWELLCYARAGVFTDSAYLIYYSQRDGSIVNEIDDNYFRKKLIIEKAQVAFLKREKLLKIYTDKVYQRFMDGWYLPKLAQVSNPVVRERCVAILKEIENLYKAPVVA